MALSKTLVFNVKRCEPELVLPAEPTPREIKQLSDIDDQEGLRFLFPIIFFYPPQPPHLVEHKLDPVKTIRDGLAKALVVYYPLAGRIFEGPNRKLMVNCNGEGVMFVGADANVKLEQLGDGILPPCPYMEELLCRAPGFQWIIGCPLLFFQVTRFICGGFCLGIRMNHTLADGYGAVLFLSAISELVKGASTPSILPVWQRELLNARSPPRITCTHHEYQQSLSHNYKPLIHLQDNFIRTSVFFGPGEIHALRNQLPTPAHSCSRFDLITACLWKCRTIALEPHPSDTVRVSFLMDARKKAICLPTGYYGNAVAFPAAISRAEILCQSPLKYALDLIQQAKARLNEEYLKSFSDLMVIKGRPMHVRGWNFIVSDTTSLGFDKFELGYWGEPMYGGIVWATPVISVYSRFKNDKGEDGVVVPICLPSLALEKFQNELKKMIAPISKI